MSHQRSHAMTYPERNPILCLSLCLCLGAFGLYAGPEARAEDDDKDARPSTAKSGNSAGTKP